ncbi:ROK family protein [Nocardioides solisilvae]|uniref:ROK family protein n=1 Tax=Nocardioides solisilvae TaxID=1542435 RepID=UPI000D74D520|nr:ROK family protein [Nocardioides solisilvae]
MTGPVWVGVDVGGTKILAGEVGADGAVRRTAVRPTPGRDVPVAWLEDVLTEAVLEVADGRRLAGVGLAAAGFVDADGERVAFAPHLPWRDDPVRARLADRWGARVALDNDANCAAFAEAELGAARQDSSAVLVTVGTGLGGGIVLDGRVLRGAGGMAGELGHMTVVPDGLPCECGGRGCWEQYCSGRALLRLARSGWGSGSLLEELCDGDPARLTGALVSRAAAQGDDHAQRALADVGRWLGLGLANVVAALDPGCLVVGGGVSAAGEGLLDPARRALTASLVGAAHRRVPPVRLAALGAGAGMVGAALLARLDLPRR